MVHCSRCTTPPASVREAGLLYIAPPLAHTATTIRAAFRRRGISFAEVAREIGVALAQVALAWMLHKPGITAPIIGATKAHHLNDAFKALEVKLSPEQISRLEEPYRPHPVLGFS